MGLALAWKATDNYEIALTAYGLSASTLPAELNVRVCDYARQEYDKVCGYVNGYTLTLQMVRAGAFVALFILGPTQFANFDERYGVSAADAVRSAVNAWQAGKPDSSLEGRIIQAVMDVGMLHSEYHVIFRIDSQGLMISCADNTGYRELV